MLHQLMAYFVGLTQSFGRPQTYGSALEAYIASHNPQTPEDIERLQRQFDQTRKTNLRWDM